MIYDSFHFLTAFQVPLLDTRPSSMLNNFFKMKNYVPEIIVIYRFWIFPLANAARFTWMVLH